MKLFNLSIALAFSLTLAAGMGSKRNPTTPIDEPKVLPESTRASAPGKHPVKLIENTVEDNQIVEKELDKPTAQPDAPVGSTKATKAKTPVAKKKKATTAKKSKAKKNSKKLK